MISGPLNGQEDRTRRDAEVKISKVQKNPPSLRSTTNEAWICGPHDCSCTIVCFMCRRSPTTFPKRTFLKSCSRSTTP